MRKALLLAAALLSLGACGTYSSLRSADTLGAGYFDFQAAVAFNQLGEGLPVLQIAGGATDDIEFVAQYEVYSALLIARYGAAHTIDNGYALALEAGTGWVNLLSSLSNTEMGKNAQYTDQSAIMAGLTIGRSFSSWEPYFSYRCHYLPGVNSTIQPIKAGVKLNIGEHLTGVFEGGASIHDGNLTIGEFTVGVGARL